MPSLKVTDLHQHFIALKRSWLMTLKDYVSYYKPSIGFYGQLCLCIYVIEAVTEQPLLEFQYILKIIKNIIPLHSAKDRKRSHNRVTEVLSRTHLTCSHYVWIALFTDIQQQLCRDLPKSHFPHSAIEKIHPLAEDRNCSQKLQNS